MRDAYEWWGKSVAIAALIVCLTQVNVHAAEPPGSAPMEASELFRRASPSIVVVEARVSQGISQGSGVVVGDGEIVTNHHVVDGAIGFVLIRQGPAVWRAEITLLDKDRDLAILAVILRKKGETFTLPQVRKRKAASVRVGEKAYAIGAPRGLERTLSEGLVSGLPSSKPTLPDGFVPDDPEPPQPTLIQTTAAISPGSSGGGLFDARGQLFGITTVYLKDSQNINFAVSADDVAFLQQSVPNTTKYELPAASQVAEVAASLSTQRRTDLPTSLGATRAVLVLAQITGPVAVQGGLTSEWAASHVIDRLRRSGVVAYENPADARRDSVYAVPLFVEVNSLHIDDSVFYVWQLSLKLSDTVDFSDGSNHYVDVWSSGTHGYGGSKAVVSQVSTVLDQYTDQFAIDLLKARQP